MECAFAKGVEEHTKKPFLILAPLAVSHQTILEAEKILGMKVTLASSDSDIRDRGVFVTNYSKLHKFDGKRFGGMAADESGCIKGEGSKTLALMEEQFSQTPFRLCCTATPSPNSQDEIGQHSEFLGVLTMSEMLSTFFIHDAGETQLWRLKGHAEKEFWKWMASWSVLLTKPSDLGYSDEGYDLPPLRIHEIIVQSEKNDDELFPMEATDLTSQREARKISLLSRLEKVKEIIGESGDSWIIWSGLNVESNAVTKAVEGCLEVEGSDDDDWKEKTLLGFAKGDVKRLSTKAKIAGYGLNLQICHKQIFFGLDHSFESLWQAIRRSWRFGQKNPVDIYIIMSDRDGAVMRNIKRKQSDAEKMQRELALEMAEFSKRELHGARRTSMRYIPNKEMFLPKWILQS